MVFRPKHMESSINFRGRPMTLLYDHNSKSIRQIPEFINFGSADGRAEMQEGPGIPGNNGKTRTSLISIHSNHWEASLSLGRGPSGNIAVAKLK